MDCILLKTGCQSKLESFEKYLSLSDYTDLKKGFHRFLIILQCICNPCNRFIIGVIRDFWTFPEISKVEVGVLQWRFGMDWETPFNRGQLI